MRFENRSLSIAPPYPWHCVAPLGLTSLLLPYPPFRLRMRSAPGWANFATRLRRWVMRGQKSRRPITRLKQRSGTGKSACATKSMILSGLSSASCGAFWRVWVFLPARQTEVRSALLRAGLRQQGRNLCFCYPALIPQHALRASETCRATFGRPATGGTGARKILASVRALENSGANLLAPA